MRFSSFITLAAITIALPPDLPAETVSPPTTLAAYLQQAQSANPDLQTYATRYEAARARIPQARALPDPMLQVTHFAESVQTRTGPQENIIMLSQRVPWFGRLSGREQIASEEAEAIHYAFQARQLTLARLVGINFYDYAFAGKAIELTTENLRLLEKLEPQVEERARTGGNLNNLLRLQVEIGRLRDRLASLQAQRIQHSARLAALLAWPDAETLPWPTWSPLDSASLPHSFYDQTSLLTAVDTQNPELLMLERKILSARARTELARLETRPDFTFGLTYIQVGRPVVNPTTPDAGRDPWGVSLSVNLPIWNQKNRHVRQEADASQRTAENELAERRSQLRAETLVALSAATDARRRVRLYEDDLLPLARQAVANTLASYQGDRASLLELIDSERSQLDLELQLWRAQADAAQQKLTLQSLANQPL